MGRQHQGMNRPGVLQVPEGSGERGKMEKTGCKIICGALTTLAVKELMMMMMMRLYHKRKLLLLLFVCLLVVVVFWGNKSLIFGMNAELRFVIVDRGQQSKREFP